MGYGGILNRESVEKGAVVANYPVADGYSINKGNVVDVVNGEVVKPAKVADNITNVFYSSNIQLESVIHLRDNVNIIAATRGHTTGACWVVDDNGKTVGNNYYDFSSKNPIEIKLNKVDEECFILCYNENSTHYYKFGKYDSNGFSYINTYTNRALDTIVNVGGNKIFGFIGDQGSIIYWVGTYSKTSGLSQLKANTKTSLNNAVYASPIVATKLPDDAQGNKRACICFQIAGTRGLGAVTVTMKSDNTAVTDTMQTIESKQVLDGFSAATFKNNTVAVGKNNLNSSSGSVIAFEVNANNKIANITNTLNIATGVNTNPSIVALEDKIVVCIAGKANIVDLNKNTLALGKKADYSGSAELDVATSTSKNKFLVCYSFYSLAYDRGEATSLEVSGNEIAGSFEYSSTQAIALNSGTSGQNIDIVYSGPVEYEAPIGTKIESNGVKGYVPVENVLDVIPWYATGGGQ